jgi:hypothetical protein
VQIEAVLPDFPFYQVVPLDLAHRLKVYGIPQISLFYWWLGAADGKWRLAYRSELGQCYTIERVAAHTSAELGAMLPAAATTRRFLDQQKMWRCAVSARLIEAGSTEAEARARLLLKLNGCENPDAPLDAP